MNPPTSFGSWNEERLYVLRTLEEVRDEQKKQIAEMAAERSAMLVKGQKDIQAAHDKIRVLESSGHQLEMKKHKLEIKNWLMAALLSGVGLSLVELAKYFLPLLHWWKP